ncbi:Lrp/AsnC family transcriptional regulator [Specibacter cremeus]|uniref:Lrp/AsnC family transcriptional regulator n=1 Tax=Specibacter cremeus TaxID=1629051 RepID=UPI000F7B2142|nr:Lrp/AsnC family transcriptional regulator [Specibacter cremeus]
MNELDKSLVHQLQKDGRASFSDLAKAVGSNRTAVAARVNQLLGSGEVRVVAAVHPRVLGRFVLAHMAVKVANDGSAAFRGIADLDAAVYIAETTGPYQLVLEVHLATMGELYDVMAHIRSLPEVLEVEVLVYEHVIRSWFLGEEPALEGMVLDRTDIDIMTILQRDGRVGFAELGASVGLSMSACRARVLRLVDANVMQVGAIVRRGEQNGAVVFGAGVTLSGDTEEILDLLSRVDGVEFVARTVGRYSLVVTIGVDSQSAYNRIVHSIRALPSVLRVDTWLHTSVLLERYEDTLDKLVPAHLAAASGS